jgi:aminotransferase in exopolysaccharide biosynthesis
MTLKKNIPLSIPSLNGNEWKYVKDCLDTNWVSSAGSYISKFEAGVSLYTGAKYSVACVNGTSALYISLLVTGVKPGDEVIVPSLTFVAPVNAILYCGASPVFMDSDEYYNLDIYKTIDFILNETHLKDKNGSPACYNRKTGKHISAIIPVHVFGNAVLLDKLVQVCRENNIKIIEDASESLGTYYTGGSFAGKHTGTIGDIGCLSFNGNKIITTGGGGMILTDNKEYAAKAKYLTTQAKDDEIKYIHNEMGFNFRLTNIPAAIGLAQLEMLPGFLEAKKRNYNCYKEQIEQIEGLKLAGIPDYAENNLWMYALQINKSVYGYSAEELIMKLTETLEDTVSVQTRPVWYLNHKQKYLQKYQSYFVENAALLHENTINIPCSTSLTSDEILTVTNKLRKLKK